ncbi:MAG TPA: aminotransferase class IV [Mycobacteriales bacterium]|nr:aminotransferase class IV [Mycobacteriales bacterium]
MNASLPRLMLLDGLRAVDPSAPVLRADDLGVLRGESVFETLRVGAGRPAFLDAHLARLGESARRLDLDLPDGWAELADLACTGVDDGVLRLVCSKGSPASGPVGFALVTAVPEETRHGREHGVAVVTMSLGVTAQQRATAPWLLGGVKATSYAVNMASLRHGRSAGAEDVIWVSTDDQVLEAPTSTVAVVRDGVLVSPPPEVGVLPGTTLAAVCGLVPFESRPLGVAELVGADEVMLLSSVRGVAPVVRLDGAERATGPVTSRLRAAYETAVRG